MCPLAGFLGCKGWMERTGNSSSLHCRCLHFQTWVDWVQETGFLSDNHDRHHHNVCEDSRCVLHVHAPQTWMGTKTVVHQLTWSGVAVLCGKGSFLQNATIVYGSPGRDDAIIQKWYQAHTFSMCLRAQPFRHGNFGGRTPLCQRERNSFHSGLHAHLLPQSALAPSSPSKHQIVTLRSRLIVCEETYMWLPLDATNSLTRGVGKT
jgi:hypothetical protein